MWISWTAPSNAMMRSFLKVRVCFFIYFFQIYVNDIAVSISTLCYQHTIMQTWYLLWYVFRVCIHKNSIWKGLRLNFERYDKLVCFINCMWYMNNNISLWHIKMGLSEIYIKIIMRVRKIYASCFFWSLYFWLTEVPV